ncbi:ABC transporter substrate-binding protein [Bifidobacterium avesanii]|nr:extracellular solute-binding protein [Bifidobacterium avesanii]KAB8292669.1 Bacterial extracellular solute-binding protein [Bifidobacterium avesanii]
MTRKFTKMMTAGCGIVAALSMALGGCGASGGNGGATAELSKDDVTLRVSWWGGDTRLKKTEDVIAQFEKEYPNIHVEPEYADMHGYLDKLSTQLAGGEAPDVVQMDVPRLASFAAQGVLADLSGLKQLDLGDIDASTVSTGQYEGVQYGAPISTAAIAVVINRDMLDKYGVQMPDTSKWTWDEFTAFQQEILKKSNGEVYGATLIKNDILLNYWARQHGEELYTDGKVSISADTLAGYLDQTAEFVKLGIVGNADRWSESAAASLGQTDFATAKSAVAFISSNQITAYSASLNTENLTLAPVPSDTQNGWGYEPTSMYWSVTSKSEHPAEAALFINYFINNQSAGDILGTERGVPSNKTIREAVAKTAAAPDKEALSFVDTFDPLCGDAPRLSPPGSSDTSEVLGRYQQKVVFGDMSAADAAKAMIEEVQANLDAAK